MPKPLTLPANFNGKTIVPHHATAVYHYKTNEDDQVAAINLAHELSTKGGYLTVALSYKDGKPNNWKVTSSIHRAHVPIRYAAFLEQQGYIRQTRKIKADDSGVELFMFYPTKKAGAQFTPAEESIIYENEIPVPVSSPFGSTNLQGAVADFETAAQRLLTTAKFEMSNLQQVVDGASSALEFFRSQGRVKL